VLPEFGGRSKKVRKFRGIKELSNSMISIIFKNNTMIRIWAIELLNTFLLLVLLMINSLLTKNDSVPWQF
jgi:hypothetical protein